MQALSGWIEQLGFLILFAGLVEIVLPESQVRKMTRLLIGLVIILAIIEPVVSLVVEPEWVDRLLSEALFEDPEPYVQAGVAMAEQTGDRAEAMWVEGAARDLAVMLTLLDGVEDADVAIVVRDRASPWLVDVTLRSAAVGGEGDEGGSAESVDFRRRKEAEVRALVLRLMRPAHIDEVRIAWESSLEIRRGG